MINTEQIEPNPPRLVILLVLETFFSYVNFPEWRDHIPFGICDSSSNCWLRVKPPGWQNRYIPELSNSDHNHTYAFQTPTVSLGVISTRDSLVALTILVITIRHIKAFLMPRFCNIGRRIGRSTHGQCFNCFVG